MWIICRELRTLYGDRLSDSESVLMAQTLDLARDIAISGEITEDRRHEARELQSRWEAFMADHEGSVKAGQWNTWVVFGELCGEFAGIFEQYTSCEMLYIAATDRWREKARPDGRSIWMNKPDEEIADDSPMAQMLSRLNSVVAGVARTSERDPAQARREILS
jgi:hypothetical protein